MTTPEPSPPDDGQGEDQGDGPGALDWLPRPVVIGLIVTIAVMWVANNVLGWIDPTKSAPAVNGAFMIILGVLFTRTGLGRRVGRRIGRAIDGRDAPDGKPDPPEDPR